MLRFAFAEDQNHSRSDLPYDHFLFITDDLQLLKAPITGAFFIVGVGLKNFTNTGGKHEADYNRR